MPVKLSQSTWFQCDNSSSQGFGNRKVSRIYILNSTAASRCHDWVNFTSLVDIGKVAFKLSVRGFDLTIRDRGVNDVRIRSW